MSSVQMHLSNCIPRVYSKCFKRKYVALARLILTSYSRIKDALFFKMFIYMYKKDFQKKNIFFFALTGRPEAIYFAL